MPTIRTAAGKTSELTPDEADTNMKRQATAQASNYSLTAAHNRDFHELANGVVATLPTASSSLTETDDWEVTLKAVGASATVGRNSQTIDDAASDLTLTDNEVVTIVMNAAQDGFYIKNRSLSSGIKTKKLTGTTSSSEGGTASIAHGLTSSTIRGVQAVVFYTANDGVPPSYTGVNGYQFNVDFTAANVVVRNHATNSENILSKDVVVIVTYEQ